NLKGPGDRAPGGAKLCAVPQSRLERKSRREDQRPASDEVRTQKRRHGRLAGDIDGEDFRSLFRVENLRTLDPKGAILEPNGWPGLREKGERRQQRHDAHPFASIRVHSRPYGSATVLRSRDPPVRTSIMAFASSKRSSCSTPFRLSIVSYGR